MTIDASLRTETFDPDNLLMGADARAEEITLTDGEVVVRGHVLGRVTATGKYLISLNAAIDGSEIARVIAAEPLSPSGSDGLMLGYLEGSFNQDKVTLGTGQTIANTKDDLNDVNIYLLDPVTKTPV